MTLLRLRIVSYDGEYGRTYYVMNVKTDSNWEVLKSFLNRKDAERWKNEQEAAQKRIEGMLEKRKKLRSYRSLLQRGEENFLRLLRSHK
jgi:hypothetical protein